MEPRERILQGANQLFKTRGIRSVTMDDIARELGMSKKTVYQYFENKADIVHAVVQLHFMEEKRTCDVCLAEAADPVQEILLLLQSFARTFSEIPANMIYDVRKYYPESWVQFDHFKNEFIMQMVMDNLQRGVASGLYRQDMDIEIVAKLRVTQIDEVMNPDIFPPHRYDMLKVQMEIFALFLHGVVTMKGKKLIYKYLNQPEDE